MKKTNMGMKKSILVALLAVAMTAGLCITGNAQTKDTGIGALHNPEVKESFLSGQKVEWDCVYFGQYPQTEVVSKEGVYQTLQTADGWSASGDITVNGVKYRRIKSADASNVEGYESYEEYQKNPVYYYWENDTDYHYFRYEPIKWRVLQTDGKEAFLLSDQILDTMRYNTEWKHVNWETCDLRSWLNGYNASQNIQGTDFTGKGFLQCAFSEKEADALKTAQLVNTDYQATQDKVFLLSKEEVYGEGAVKYGFSEQELINDEARRTTVTNYAWAMGTGITTDGMFKGNGYWWLRSMGFWDLDATGVAEAGLVNTEGNGVHRNKNGIRPGVVLDLSKTETYQYAGKVCSNKTVLEGDGTLDNPVITKMGVSMTVDQIVTWDCLYFGEYPQSEIVNKDAEYEILQKASGWDDKNDVVLNGIRYHRMLSTDAAYKKEYASYEEYEESKEYYYWADNETYHYFKYEPIKWRILKIDNERALLLADQALDVQPYHGAGRYITWEQATIRSWLNGYGAAENAIAFDYTNHNFIGRAFTQQQKEAILETQLEGEKNLSSGISGGNTTTDKIFLLAQTDMSTKAGTVHGFMEQASLTDEGRRASGSDYAKAMGAYQSAYETDTQMRIGWWVRNPGEQALYAEYVDGNGVLNVRGEKVDYKRKGVRPALWLNLKESEIYQYAGETSSDGTVKEAKPQPSKEAEATQTPLPTPSSGAAAAQSPSPSPSNEPENSTSPKPNSTEQTTQAPGQILRGDVNNDKKVTLKDAQIVLRTALKLSKLEGDLFTAADVNNDKKITLKDAQTILKAALHLIVL